MLSGQSTDQTMHVLEGTVTPSRHKMTVPVIIITGMCIWSVPAIPAFLYNIVQSLGDAISQGRQIHDR